MNKHRIPIRKITDEEILIEIRNKHAFLADEDAEKYYQTGSIIDLRKSVMADRVAMQAIRDRARYSIETKK